MRGNKKIIFLMMFALFVLFGLNSVYALSNESVIANESLSLAMQDINILVQRDIPVNRVNEIYSDALQLYEAQVALEESGKIADYEIVIKYCEDIGKIKKDALNANDQLNVFVESYKETSKDANLSEMEGDYNEIVKSFNEERFEDTLKLIDGAYYKMSEIESSQTGLRLFYEATTASVKKWFIENWKNLVIGFVLLLIIYLITYKSLKRFRLKREIKSLVLKKAALNNLIKKLQKQYFSDNKISETEYNVKIERFKEMIRDVDRQIPLLNEKLAKLDYRNKPIENPLSSSNMLNNKDTKKVVGKYRKKKKM
jgi:ABC-type transport system involved in multi-copper enzyme maturation permease subunit